MTAEWVLVTIMAVIAVVAVWQYWQHRQTRKQIDNYAEFIRKITTQEAPCLVLQQDEKGVEKLPNAVRLLVAFMLEQVEYADNQHSQLAAILNYLDDGVLIVDGQGGIQYANAVVEQIFHSQGRGLDGLSIIGALRFHQMVDIWQRCLELGYTQTDVVKIPAYKKILQITVIPNQYQPGGTFILIRDLTRKHHLEAVRRDFISNLSHELRTPLASLKVLTETLQTGAINDPPAAHRFLNRIEVEVDALTQMAQELLDLSRIEAGQIKLDLQPVDPTRLLYLAIDRMRLQIERAKLKIILPTPTIDLPDVQADVLRVEQVLVNLIHNAIKFSHPQGNLIFGLTATGKEVQFSVQDTGVGISADIVARIFERFYKGDVARSSQGTGLGLSISRHLIEAHGGKIWAESVEGQGSTFLFTLPVASTRLKKLS